MPVQTPYELIQHLPIHDLFAVAKNESAGADFKTAAVKLLLEAGVEVAEDELAAIVEKVKPEITIAKLAKEAKEESAGALKASITTASLNGVQKVDEPEPESEEHNEEHTEESR